MKKGGCWIFLSHSSRDIMKVRIIRNEFEKHGQNPLTFHLRCLNADTEEGRKELDSLIKREIDAREWFVFCESEAAANSEYVQMEKAYIIASGKKKIWSIDMTLPIEKLIDKVNDICTQIKVYISHRKRKYNVAHMLEEELVKRDFDVWTDNWLTPGEQFQQKMSKEIEEAAQYGFLVAIISDDFAHSFQATFEVPYAISKGAKIIPLVLGDTEIPDIFRKYRCYRIPNAPKESDMFLIAELIETELRMQIDGPIKFGKADLYNVILKIDEQLNYQNKYHPQDAILVGATDDYCEIYEFPCCGKRIMVGNGPVSRFRCDGCCGGNHL